MNSEKKIMLSGVKPTGRPHVGNYFGAMRQFVDLQEKFAGFVMIADYHALNFVQNAAELKQNILDLAIDYLAIGLDPAKITIFKQSDVSAHTELAWIFDTITTMPYLMRAHAYKDAEAKNKEIGVGTFNYPMLMAADILLYSPDVVPVGQDQKQHVEYARDTAEKFNRIFGETFKLPKEHIIENVKVVPGIDGQKMSKSYGNTIQLFATDEEIKKAVMSIPTDSKSVDEPKNPNTDKVYALIKLFAPESVLAEITARYTNGPLSYKEAKEILIKYISDFVRPLRERRAEIAKDNAAVLKILQEGGKRANEIAQAKMNEVREKIGVKLY